MAKEKPRRTLPYRDENVPPEFARLLEEEVTRGDQLRQQLLMTQKDRAELSKENAALEWKLVNAHQAAVEALSEQSRIFKEILDKAGIEVDVINKRTPAFREVTHNLDRAFFGEVPAKKLPK